MNIIHNDDNTSEFLDEAGMAFMALMVHELNGRLKENGVADPQQRQEICADFLFSFAYNLDAGWFVHEDKKLFPKICLAERHPPEEEGGLGAIHTLFVPTDATSWHEYAYGLVSQYFEDDQESVADIRTGSFDSEN